jgi:hypothetical protein
LTMVLEVTMKFKEQCSWQHQSVDGNQQVKSPLLLNDMFVSRIIVCIVSVALRYAWRDDSSRGYTYTVSKDAALPSF